MEVDEEEKVVLCTRWLFVYYCGTEGELAPGKPAPKVSADEIWLKLRMQGAKKAAINWEKNPTKENQYHWQGCVWFGARKRNSTCQNRLWKGYWAKQEGTWDENVTYCTKEASRLHATFGPFTWGISAPRVPRTGLEERVASNSLAPWQSALFAMIENTPEAERPKRNIYWFWSDAGTRGKSSTFAWLEDKYDCIATEMIQDTARMLYSIASEAEPEKVKAVGDGKPDYPAIIVDIPRACPHDYVLLETLCGERFSNTFQKPCRIRLNPCFKIVFANQPPNCDPDLISPDRFIVTCVD